MRPLGHEVDDRHACRQERGRHGDPDPAAPARARRARRCGDRRCLGGAENGVRGDEAERQVSLGASGWSGASGRLRMPSRVTYFDHESCSAAMSSGMNRGEALTRAALSAPRDLEPGALLALQAGVYRYGEAVDLASKLVDRATSGVKTVVQGGGS